MSNITIDVLVQRVNITHGFLLKVTQDLTEEQFARRVGPTAPPIGWHLWHIARWADRLHASFPHRIRESDLPPNPSLGLWEVEDMTIRWKLSPVDLGLAEAGGGMAYDMAAAIALLGRDNILDYARRAFMAADQAVARLNPEDLEKPRKSIMAYDSTGGVLRPAPGKDTTHLADILYHVGHASRHLGMIEALRGVLGMSGTATA